MPKNEEKKASPGPEGNQGDLRQGPARPAPAPAAARPAPGAESKIPAGPGPSSDDPTDEAAASDNRLDPGEVFVVLDGDEPSAVSGEIESLFEEALRQDAVRAATKKDRATKPQGDQKELLREKALLNRQIDSLSAEMYNLKTEMKRQEEERAELIDQVKRAQAELINFRKRTERDREEMSRLATADIVEQLLPILDNFERAFASAGPDVPKSFLHGFDLILQSLLSILKKQGLSVIEAKGKQFDPNVHEAVMAVPTTEHRNDEVLEEMQRGYRFNDRLLRPVMVKVARNEAEEDRGPAGDFFDRMDLPSDLGLGGPGAAETPVAKPEGTRAPPAGPDTGCSGGADGPGPGKNAEVEGMAATAAPAETSKEERGVGDASESGRAPAGEEAVVGVAAPPPDPAVGQDASAQVGARQAGGAGPTEEKGPADLDDTVRDIPAKNI